MTITALVPIKSNSTRLPNKNFKFFNGKPLFHHVLETLQNTDEIGLIYVNTDSIQVKNDCVHLFSKVRIIERPEHLIEDEITMNTIIDYDLSRIEGEHFLQTHCTNPLLSKKTIRECIQSYLGNLENHDSLLSVDCIQKRTYRKNGTAINHDSEIMLQTQELEPIYIENSNLFLFSRASFYQAGKNRVGKTPLFYPTPTLESIDIDYPEDFTLAELIAKNRNNVHSE